MNGELGRKCRIRSNGQPSGSVAARFWLESVLWLGWRLFIPDLCQGPKKVRDPGFTESKVPRFGTLMDLGPRTSFLSWDCGNPGPQNYDMPQDPGNPGPQYFDMQRDPGNPGPQNFESRKTLETQDLKIWICGETLETQNPEPQNFDVPRLLNPWTLHHSIQNFMLSIVPGRSTGDELGRSDSKNLNCKK